MFTSFYLQKRAVFANNGFMRMISDIIVAVVVVLPGKQAQIA